MRTLFIIPIAIALAVGVGYAVCGTMHVDPHVREMLFAAVVCLIASEGAMIPILLTRGASQARSSSASCALQRPVDGRRGRERW